MIGALLSLSLYIKDEVHNRLIIVIGCAFVLSMLSLVAIIHKLWGARVKSHLGSMSGGDMLYRQAKLDNGPKVVAIGGGTGLSALLRSVKTFTSNITAVVTVADNGGNSGQLRQEFGVLPPGDIRNCLIALSQVEPSMERLLQYRFDEGTLDGYCIGNLLLVAQSKVNDGFLRGIKEISDVLAVTGRVLPVTLNNVHLNARMNDNRVIEGEQLIGHAQRDHGGFIERVWLTPSGAKVLPEVEEAIEEADIILMGPGSLYTSLLPNLLVSGVSEAIKESKAMKVYVANLMTQPGETEGYNAQMHVKAIEDHTGTRMFDYILINSNLDLPAATRKRYMADHAMPVSYDRAKLREMGYKVVDTKLMKEQNGHIRHSMNRLAAAVTRLYTLKR